MAYDRLRTTILPSLARRVHVQGLEHVPTSGPYIVAANHQSYNDAPLVAFPLIEKRNVKVWFPTTEHVWKAFGKFGGQRLLRWLGMIPISEAKKAAALEPAIDILRSGGVVGIFPEGRRNKPPVNPEWETVMLKGKTGVARLAIATGAPVIPCGIIAPKGLTAFQAIRNFISRKQPAVIRFGDSLRFHQQDLTTVTRDELDGTTDEIMRAVARLCGKSYPFNRGVPGKQEKA